MFLIKAGRRVVVVGVVVVVEAVAKECRDIRWVVVAV